MIDAVSADIESTERGESLAKTVEMICIWRIVLLDEVTGVRGQTIQL